MSRMRWADSGHASDDRAAWVRNLRRANQQQEHPSPPTRPSPASNSSGAPPPLATRSRITAACHCGDHVTGTSEAL